MAPSIDGIIADYRSSVEQLIAKASEGGGDAPAALKRILGNTPANIRTARKSAMEGINGLLRPRRDEAEGKLRLAEQEWNEIERNLIRIVIRNPQRAGNNQWSGLNEASRSKSLVVVETTRFAPNKIQGTTDYLPLTGQFIESGNFTGKNGFGLEVTCPKFVDYRPVPGLNASKDSLVECDKLVQEAMGALDVIDAKANSALTALAQPIAEIVQGELVASITTGFDSLDNVFTGIDTASRSEMLALLTTTANAKYVAVKEAIAKAQSMITDRYEYQDAPLMGMQSNIAAAQRLAAQLKENASTTLRDPVLRLLNRLKEVYSLEKQAIRTSYIEALAASSLDKLVETECTAIAAVAPGDEALNRLQTIAVEHNTQRNALAVTLNKSATTASGSLSDTVRTELNGVDDNLLRFTDLISTRDDIVATYRFAGDALPPHLAEVLTAKKAAGAQRFAATLTACLARLNGPYTILRTSDIQPRIVLPYRDGIIAVNNFLDSKQGFTYGFTHHTDKQVREVACSVSAPIAGRLRALGKTEDEILVRLTDDYIFLNGTLSGALVLLNADMTKNISDENSYPEGRMKWLFVHAGKPWQYEPEGNGFAGCQVVRWSGEPYDNASLDKLYPENATGNRMGTSGDYRMTMNGKNVVLPAPAVTTSSLRVTGATIPLWSGDELRLCGVAVQPLTGEPISLIIADDARGTYRQQAEQAAARRLVAVGAGGLVAFGSNRLEVWSRVSNTKKP